MAQNQNVNIKATVSVDDSQVKQYNETLNKTEQATEKAFNPKRAVREATQELLKAQQQFGEYSTQAINAAKKVAQLKDSIQEASETAALFDPGKKFAAFSGALNSVAAGYGAVQGAIGLLGVESSKVQEQLLKVQSALALSEGLSTILDSGKDFARLGAIIKNQVVTAFQTLKGAIISTGIGALVIALGVIVANWDKIKATVSGVSKEQEDLNKKTAANVEAQQKKLDAIGGQENVLKLQGKSERDILKLKIQQTDAVIAATEEQVRQSQITLKAQIEAEKRNKSILKGILDFLVAPTQLVVDLLSKAAKVFGVDFKFDIAEFTSSFVFDPKKVEEEGNKAIAEQQKTIEKLKNDRAGLQLSLQDIDKKAADDSLAKRKKQQEDELKAEKEFLQKRREAQLEANAAVAANSDDIVKKQKDFLADQNNLIVKGSDDALKAFGKSVSEQNKKAIELSKADEERNKLALQREDEKRKAYQMTGDALNALADIVGKQTAAGKALAVSQALINTFLGITEVLRNKTVIPEPFGTVQKIASIATIAASGFAAVKNIVKTQVPGGGGGGASANIPSAGASAPITPGAQQAPTTTLDQRSINTISSVTARAYVVESDVSNSQERIRRINRAATFG